MFHSNILRSFYFLSSSHYIQPLIIKTFLLTSQRRNQITLLLPPLTVSCACICSLSRGGSPKIRRPESTYISPLWKSMGQLAKLRIHNKFCSAVQKPLTDLLKLDTFVFILQLFFLEFQFRKREFFPLYWRIENDIENPRWNTLLKTSP